MNVIVYCTKCYDDKFQDAPRVPQGDPIYTVEIGKCLCLLHLIRSRKKSIWGTLRLAYGQYVISAESHKNPIGWNKYDLCLTNWGNWSTERWSKFSMAMDFWIGIQTEAVLIETWWS